jgi:signal transduction histidine kinase
VKQFASVASVGLRFPAFMRWGLWRSLRAGAEPAPAPLPEGDSLAGKPAPQPFNLLRWFSIASLAALLPVAAVTGTILSHFVTQQSLQRDALLTAQFIYNCLGVEAAQIGASSLVPFLDPRVDTWQAGLSPASVAQARSEVYEHLGTLPDVLLASVYARDGRIVWSTNRELIGTYSTDNDELKEALNSHVDVARHHASNVSERAEQKFVVEPKEFFIENYVPLIDPKGNVLAVVEVYKEPRNLMDSIRTGQILVWSTTLGGGIVIYLGLFSIVRRGARVLQEQQRQLVEAQSQVFAGEMATALAHSLRNPLASVRSSAELALCTDDVPVRKNAQDIITQVDFLSQWVRELLLYSRPITGEEEAVDLCMVLENLLASFRPNFERAHVRVTWERNDLCNSRVHGNTSLVRQALHSVISNAVEAMPRGGELRMEMRAAKDPEGLLLTISDTGVGMSSQQLANAFRPFQTTKSHGLGVGLPMIKRAMERFGGSVTLSSVEKAGTEVRLHFRHGEQRHGQDSTGG